MGGQPVGRRSNLGPFVFPFEFYKLSYRRSMRVMSSSACSAISLFTLFLVTAVVAPVAVTHTAPAAAPSMSASIRSLSEVGEDASKGLEREVLEETGLKVRAVRPLFVFHEIVNNLQLGENTALTGDGNGLVGLCGQGVQL